MASSSTPTKNDQRTDEETRVMMDALMLTPIKKEPALPDCGPPATAANPVPNQGSATAAFWNAPAQDYSLVSPGAGAGSGSSRYALRELLTPNNLVSSITPRLYKSRFDKTFKRAITKWGQGERLWKSKSNSPEEALRQLQLKQIKSYIASVSSPIGGYLASMDHRADLFHSTPVAGLLFRNNVLKLKTINEEDGKNKRIEMMSPFNSFDQQGPQMADSSASSSSLQTIADEANKENVTPTMMMSQDESDETMKELEEECAKMFLG